MSVTSGITSLVKDKAGSLFSKVATRGKVGAALGLGLTKEHPFLAQAITGAATGYITSGFSGYGLLAGAATGTLGGALGVRHERNSFSFKNPRPQLQMPKFQINRTAGGAKVPKAFRSGRNVVSWKNAFGGSMNMGSGTLTLTDKSGSLRNEIQSIVAASKISHQAKVESAFAEHAKNVIGYTQKKMTLGPRGRLAGAAIGGAVGGLSVLGLKAIGSSFGSNNRQPYGMTFSGMGNGTVRGY